MEDKNYTGLRDGEIGLLDRTVGVMLKMCHIWIGSDNNELSDAAMMMMVIVEHLDNMLDSKIGGTIDLVSERRKLGYID